MEMERWNDGGSQQQQEFGSSGGNQTRDDKKPGKTRPQTNLVTCGHAHDFSSFSFSFLVFKIIKIYLNFELQLINIFMHHRRRTGTIFIIISPQSQIDTIKPQLTSKGSGTSASGPFASSAMFRSVLATVVVAVPVSLGGVV